MRLVIEGYALPGARFESRQTGALDNVHVGIQLGKRASELIRADADSVRWEIEVTVVDRPDGVDFRGPAVQGRRGGRFVYLTWGNVDGDGGFDMFRRAKLMLDDLEPALRQADSVTVRLGLSDAKGEPLCARVPASALRIGR